MMCSVANRAIDVKHQNKDIPQKHLEMRACYEIEQMGEAEDDDAIQ